MKLTSEQLRRIIKEEIESSRSVTIPYMELRKIVDDLSSSRSELRGTGLRALESLEGYLGRSDEEELGRKFPMGKHGKRTSRE